MRRPIGITIATVPTTKQEKSRAIRRMAWSMVAFRSKQVASLSARVALECIVDGRPIDAVRMLAQWVTCEAMAHCADRWVVHQKAL